VPDVQLITCEHGGNAIPAPFGPLFTGHRALLDSHRGWDPGALLMAEALATATRAPMVASTTSRLLVDLNRSIGHPQLFSPMTRVASREVRAQIVAQHYRPHRDAVEDLVRQSISSGHRVIHIASHSFTPELDGIVRQADVGLLYDPRRRAEVQLSMRWQESLATLHPGLRVRRNYPYAGKGDGLTSHLRKRFGEGGYVGIELEINQRIVAAAGQLWATLRGVLIDSLHSACARHPNPTA